MWKYHVDNGICQLNLNNSRIFEENTTKTPHTLGLGNHISKMSPVSWHGHISLRSDHDAQDHL